MSRAKSASAGVLACALLLCSVARADISCSGTLGGVLMYSDGTVLIYSSWRNDWTMICNTQNGFGGVDTATCLSWYAAAVKSAQSHVTVGTYYNGNAYTCANLPTYESTPPTVYLIAYAT